MTPRVLLLPTGHLPLGMLRAPEGAILVWPTDARSIEVPPGHVLQEIDPVKEGDRWVQRWEAVKSPPELELVPEKVTMAQACLAMRRAGILHLIPQAIKSMPDEDQREEALIAWERATVIERAHPLVEQLKPSLGLSAEDLDNLFILASKL